MNLQAHVLFALAYVSSPPPIQFVFQQPWPGLSQSQPFISYQMGLYSGAPYWIAVEAFALTTMVAAADVSHVSFL
jgi:hypothetical protein